MRKMGFVARGHVIGLIVISFESGTGGDALVCLNMLRGEHGRLQTLSTCGNNALQLLSSRPQKNYSTRLHLPAAALWNLRDVNSLVQIFQDSRHCHRCEVPAGQAGAHTLSPLLI